MATGSGRFFGWVIGGALPASIAADWLVSAWDQNAGMAGPAPAVAMIEQVASRWVLELLGLPTSCSVGFVTGAQMATTVGLAAARTHVLAAHAWDVEADGLAGSPPVRVVVGAERHSTIDRGLRFLGLGSRAIRVVDVDDAGRMLPGALEAVLAQSEWAHDRLRPSRKRQRGRGGSVRPDPGHGRSTESDDIWFHVDGAFGLWARAVPSRRYLLGEWKWADSWATDAQSGSTPPTTAGW